ncbi:nucleotide sugar dehydrogenase [SAR86 cluster bacterium SAR86E]|uniref:UDP-glucose 6-dehydrogenase n=1 Tax=SAR86 cluster bacterium SAR86E TaxID=1208365 RepID=K6H0G8_9GAMM|nr:nucleotide sugar dehydrogenase [SAR86 cluster bacterium SAR86E]
MSAKLKITIVGAGFVGMSLSALLAQHNDVMILDVNKDRVNKINEGKTTVSDLHIEKFLATKDLSLNATDNANIAFQNANFVIVATPTDYDPNTNKFDTRNVDSVVKAALNANSDLTVVIKSTVPVGHTEFLQRKHSTKRVIFSPEFLREGSALQDNLHPSRIIVGSNCHAGKVFASLLADAADKENIKVLFVKSAEAESIKLFSNTYLAMRVSFFNELDSYALAKNLDSQSIISGVSSDHRIGDGYNNPSFGYGGYCLPKDTRQLLANYDQVPQTLIDAIVSSNSVRKNFIAEEIVKKNPKVVGFFRLVAKAGSDNFRSSAILGIIERIKEKGVGVLIYEPKLNESSFLGMEIETDLIRFKKNSDLIVANRMSESLIDVAEKCFSRDLYGEN